MINLEIRPVPECDVGLSIGVTEPVKINCDI